VPELKIESDTGYEAKNSIQNRMRRSRFAGWLCALLATATAATIGVTEEDPLVDLTVWGGAYAGLSVTESILARRKVNKIVANYGAEKGPPESGKNATTIPFVSGIAPGAYILSGIGINGLANKEATVTPVSAGITGGSIVLGVVLTLARNTEISQLESLAVSEIDGLTQQSVVIT
jgi:hypothetical protein